MVQFRQKNVLKSYKMQRLNILIVLNGVFITKFCDLLIYFAHFQFFTKKIKNRQNRLKKQNR